MADLPDILQLDDIGGGRFRIHMPSTSAEGRDVVFSGQYLAQMLMAADRVHDSGKDVRSIHAVFARAATYTKPIELVVDTVLDGRSWGNDTITATQDGKVTARSEVLLNIVEDDLLRHELTRLPLPGPEHATPTEGLYFPGVEVRQVEDEKLEIDGAPAMATWFRYPTKLDSEGGQSGRAGVGHVWSADRTGDAGKRCRPDFAGACQHLDRRHRPHRALRRAVRRIELAADEASM